MHCVLIWRNSRISADQNPGNEDIANTHHESDLLPRGDDLCIPPLVDQLIEAVAELFLVLFKLNVRLFEHGFLMLDILPLHLIPVFFKGLALQLYPLVDFLELVGEGELVEEVEDGEFVERGEVPVITVCH